MRKNLKPKHIWNASGRYNEKLRPRLVKISENFRKVYEKILFDNQDISTYDLTLLLQHDMNFCAALLRARKFSKMTKNKVK